MSDPIPGRTPQKNTLSRREVLKMGGFGLGALALASCGRLFPITQQPGRVEATTTSTAVPALTPTDAPPATKVPTAEPTKPPESTAVPTPSPAELTQLTPPVESAIKGLYLGQIDGKTFGTMKPYETPINTLYSPDQPKVARGFGIDQDYLKKYFGVVTDKGGTSAGKTPEGLPVTLENGIWKTETGETFIPFSIAQPKTNAVYQVIVNGKLQELDIKGGTVGASRPLFEAPSAIAKRLQDNDPENPTFKGIKPSEVTAVEMNPDGSLKFIQKEARPTDANPNRTGNVVHEVNFLAPAEDLTKNETAKAAVDTFANALIAAGITVTANELLSKGFTVMRVEGPDPIDKTGKTKKNYDIATMTIDDKTMGGDYSLMIRQEGGEWNGTPSKEITALNAISLGAQGLWEGLVDGTISGSYKKALGNNFNQLVIDGELHWGGGDKALRPSENEFNFKKADQLVDFAEKNGMNVQGHHLIWGIYPMIPDWLKNGNFSNEKLKTLIQDHITKVMAHYPNFSSWTVVNEAFPYGKGVDFWYDKLGEDYIDIAFEAARKASSNTLLILNDTVRNEVEGERSDFGYKTLKRLTNKGDVNLGYGFQMHIDGSKPPDVEKMIKNMKRFTDMNVKIVITEMDVDMTNFQGSAEEKKSAQAKIYYDIIKAYITAGGRDLSIFGVSDSVSWYKFTGKPDAGATLLNERYEPKADYYALLRAANDGIDSISNS